MFVKPGLLKLHQIRNKVAHNLGSDVLLKDLQSMIAIMRLMGREIEGLGPVEIIESFTTLACTFLIVTPPHLEDTFVEAIEKL